MIDIRDTLYVPGFGFIVNKTKDQSLGSPEADFAALMEQARAAQVKREAEEAAKEPFVRAELTKEDIKELAARYDPTNMSQKEYDSFLDDLIEKGVLEKEDIKYIAYHGDLVPNGEYICVGKMDFFADDSFQGAICACEWTGTIGNARSMICAYEWTGASGSAPSMSWRPTNANVLSWAKNMSLWQPYGNPSSLLDAENRRCDIYTVLADTLGAMERQR